VLRFLTGGYEAEPEELVGQGVFGAEGEGLVLVRDVEFHSLCEHHLLPFSGRVHVAYLPGSRIIGLSKIPRLVDLYARRLQVHERITKQRSSTMTRALRGLCAHDAIARHEVLPMLRER
jgi:GTP cyclohydrolase I